MIRLLCVAVIVMFFTVGLAAPAAAELLPPNPAPHGPVIAPGQLPALNVTRGTRLPSSMSGAHRPRISGGMDGTGVSGGVKASAGFGGGSLGSSAAVP
ncbi:MULTISPECIES: hypothetical protein [Mycobacteroides]|uniref:hypothetical protein n=1 Tax=Mycobacteroides TaxID=670516 RepID=UPI0009C13FCE|nr:MULTISPECIES: hypothetical protein [Mycobacteroides]